MSVDSLSGEMTTRLHQRVLLVALAFWSTAALAAPPDAAVAATDEWPGLDKALTKLSERDLGSRRGGRSPAFDQRKHKELVQSLKGVALKCTEELMSAQWRQDSWLQVYSPAHFDNCTFSEGHAYIQELLGEIDARARPDAPEAKILEAMNRVGRVLHALQDFYSHSNYVELKNASSTDDFAASFPVLPLWDPAGGAQLAALQKAGLISGTWPIGGPQKCEGPNTVSHGDLAKDTPKFSHATIPLAHPVAGKPVQNLRDAAVSLAGDASSDFLRYAYTRWPAIAKTCGPDAGYLVIVDRRATKK